MALGPQPILFHGVEYPVGRIIKKGQLHQNEAEPHTFGHSAREAIPKIEHLLFDLFRLADLIQQ